MALEPAPWAFDQGIARTNHLGTRPMPGAEVEMIKLKSGERTSAGQARHRVNGAKREKGYVTSDRPAGHTAPNGTGKRRRRGDQRSRDKRHARRRMEREAARMNTPVKPLPEKRMTANPMNTIAVDYTAMRHAAMKSVNKSAAHVEYHEKTGTGIKGECK